MKRSKALKVETMFNNFKLTFLLQPLYGLTETLSDTANADWPWQQDINWFLALAEFKRLTQQPTLHFFLLEVWSEHTRWLALPVCSTNDGRYWSSLTDVYSPSFNHISSTTLKIANPWQCLLHALSQLQPNWVYCQLSPLRQEQIQQLTELNGFLRAHVFEHSENWLANCSSNHEYWHKRPGQLKNTIKRKRAKLLSHGSRIEIHSQLTDELMLKYWQVYQQSWKQPETDRYFINWLANYSAANGMLRLGLLFIGDQPVACQLWLVHHSKAAIYKLAQVQAFNNLSPGTVLMADMMNYVIDIDKVTSIDFLTGNDNYKAMWMDFNFKLYGAELFNISSITGRWLWSKQWLKTTLKTIARKVHYLMLRARHDN